MIGRTLGGATVAILQGMIVVVICLLAGFHPKDLSSLPLALLFMVLIAVMFTALGTAIASVLSDFQGFQFVMNFLVMPIFFLSGALFPLRGVPKVIEFLATINPLSYGIDGLRISLIAVEQFSVSTDLTVLAAVTAAFPGLGSYLFLEFNCNGTAPEHRGARKSLEGGAQLIAERGIEGASMDAIARLSGVSKATLYKHWSSKEKLCLEAISNSMERCRHSPQAILVLMPSNCFGIWPACESRRWDKSGRASSGMRPAIRSSGRPGVRI